MYVHSNLYKHFQHGFDTCIYLVCVYVTACVWEIHVDLCTTNLHCHTCAYIGNKVDILYLKTSQESSPTSAIDQSNINAAMK